MRASIPNYSDISLQIEYSVFESEAALHRSCYKKVFWEYAADLLENTHAEVRFQ